MTTDDLPVWRTKKYADLTLAGVSGDGLFSGYASLFGEVDLSKDAIAPGAFGPSLQKRGAAGVRMLFQHDPALGLHAIAFTLDTGAVQFDPLARFGRNDLPGRGGGGRPRQQGDQAGNDQ